MYSQRVTLIKAEALGEIKIGLHVLRISDIEKRVGVKVIKLEVGAIDFIRDMAMIRIVYEGLDTTADKMIKFKNSQLTEL